MNPNPISLAIVVVLASLGALLIGLARLVVPGALLIVLAVILLAALRPAQIRDVTIPEAPQDAMSREAQAERERHARVILGAAEAEIAHSFAEAARSYADNPVALHLRGMNMLYESVKERGSTIIVPSS